MVHQPKATLDVCGENHYQAIRQKQPTHPLDANSTPLPNMNKLSNAVAARVSACGFTAKESTVKERWYLFAGDGSHSSQLVQNLPLDAYTIMSFCDGVLWARNAADKKLAKLIQRGLDVPFDW